jgi:hypothetical protein
VRIGFLEKTHQFCGNIAHDVGTMNIKLKTVRYVRKALDLISIRDKFINE